jgi:hypothetical protein
MAEDATQKDIALDILTMLDEHTDTGRIIGGDGTLLDKVEEGERDSIIITLDNGQRFQVQVREIAR